MGRRTHKEREFTFRTENLYSFNRMMLHTNSESQTRTTTTKSKSLQKFVG